MFQRRTDPREVQILHVGREDDRMRVPHRDERRIHQLVPLRHRQPILVLAPASHHLLPIHRDLRQVQDRLIHVDRHLLNLAAAVDCQRQRQHPPAGLDAHRVVLGQAMVKRIFRDAPHPVAAHLPLAAIGVEHAHADVGLVGRQNQDQPVRPDPRMPIRNRNRQARGISYVLGKAVDVNVVVADAVHLGEAHINYPSLVFQSSQSSPNPQASDNTRDDPERPSAIHGGDRGRAQLSR